MQLKNLALLAFAAPILAVPMNVVRDEPLTTPTPVLVHGGFSGHRPPVPQGRNATFSLTTFTTSVSSFHLHGLGPAMVTPRPIATLTPSEETAYWSQVEGDDATDDESGMKKRQDDGTTDTDGETTDDETTDGETTDDETTDDESGMKKRQDDGTTDTDGETTDGETTDGEATDGEATDGEATDGEATDGEATDGEATDGEATDGEATDGEDMDGEATG